MWQTMAAGTEGFRGTYRRRRLAPRLRLLTVWCDFPSSQVYTYRLLSAGTLEELIYQRQVSNPVPCHPIPTYPTPTCHPSPPQDLPYLPRVAHCSTPRWVSASLWTLGITSSSCSHFVVRCGYVPLLVFACAFVTRWSPALERLG